MLTLLPVILALSVQEPAVAINVSGKVTVQIGTEISPAERFMRVPENAVITTSAQSTIALRFKSGSLIRLGPNTSVNLEEMMHGAVAGKRRERIKLITGKIWTRVMKLVGQESNFEIRTAHAVAGVRGTAFWVSTGAQGDTFVVDHGEIFVSREGRAMAMLRGAGATTFASPAGITEPHRLDPEDLDTLRVEVNGIGDVIIEDLRTNLNPEILDSRDQGTRGESTRAPERFTDSETESERADDKQHGRVAPERAIIEVNIITDESPDGN